MHFRYRATYFRHLLSVMHYAGLTHAVTTSQLFLCSCKRIRLAYFGRFFPCFVLPGGSHGSKQMILSVTMWLERKTGDDLNQKMSVHLKLF